MKLFFLHLSPYQMAEENMAHKSEGNFLFFLKVDSFLNQEVTTHLTLFNNNTWIFE